MRTTSNLRIAVYFFYPYPPARASWLRSRRLDGAAGDGSSSLAADAWPRWPEAATAAESLAATTLKV